jgi:hypothetical protein
MNRTYTALRANEAWRSRTKLSVPSGAELTDEVTANGLSFSQLEPYQIRTVTDVLSDQESRRAAIQFLSSRPKSFETFIEGHERMLALFPDSRIAVEYDNSDPAPKLRCKVFTKEDVAEASAKMEQFRNDWWYQKSRDEGADLAFHLRFE